MTGLADSNPKAMNLVGWTDSLEAFLKQWKAATFRLDSEAIGLGLKMSDDARAVVAALLVVADRIDDLVAQA